MSKKIVYIDIMEKGRFLCQLRYDGMPFPEMIDGEVRPVYDSEDILMICPRDEKSIADLLATITLPEYEKYR